MRYDGIEIIVVPDRPNRQLSTDVSVSPQLREKVNLWMREFFGTSNLMEDGVITGSPELGVVWMNPRTYEEVKKHAGF
jgi:hypothetical protein